MNYRLTIILSSSPADIPKRVEDQFDYLFSLSKEEEYVQLVKQAGDVLVRENIAGILSIHLH